MAKKKKKRKKKKVKPKYKTEEQLFFAFCKQFDIFESKVGAGEVQGVSLEMCRAPVEYKASNLHGKRIHVVGEFHESRSPVDKVHEDIVPLIEEDPDSWVVLVESLESALTMDLKHSGIPSPVYFRELAKIYGLPYGKAMSSITDQETKDYIFDRLGVSNEEVDRCISILTLSAYDLENRTDERRAVSIICKDLENPDRDYACRLYEMGPIAGGTSWDDLNQRACESFFERRVVRGWNQYNRQRLPEILGAYQGRTNFLVNVGNGHIPIYE